LRIIIARIHHYDPYCPRKVIYLLESLRSLSFIPDCIAVEWDREVAEKVIAQRPHFVSLATSGGLFNHDEAVALTNTMAYEADIHKSVYPDMPIIWTDELNNEERINKKRRN